MWDSPKLRCCPRPGCGWARASSTSWDSSGLTGHPRPGCFSGREIPTPWDSSKPQCHPRRRCRRGRGPAGLAICWSWDAGWDAGGRWPPSVDTAWSSPLCSPPSVVERPPMWSKVPRKSSLLTDFLSQILCVWKILPFYFRIFPKVGYSYPQKKHAKTIKRFATLQTSLHFTTFSPRHTMLCKSVSCDLGNPSVSKTSFNGASWGQVSTACVALPRPFTASLKQRYNSDFMGGHVMVCHKSFF